MQTSEDYFTASDGALLFVRRFEPPHGKLPRAVLHIVHGLSEHGARYRQFANRLTEEDFVVVVHDARGHGLTASAPGSPGCGCVAAGVGGAIPRMVADLAELVAVTRSAWPGLPLLLFGHSFGTVISQLYAGGGAGGTTLTALVLSAPPARLPSVMAVAFRMLLAALHTTHGEHGFSAIPKKLSFDKFQRRCLAVTLQQGEPTGYEGLNRDRQEVKKYVDDPLCGQDMSVGFWCSAVEAIAQLKTPGAHAKLQDDLPVYVMAGEQDWAGQDDFGVAAYTRIQQELAGAGKRTPKILVYPQARHELLLETNREEVISDVLAFLSACLKASPRSRL